MVLTFEDVVVCYGLERAIAEVLSLWTGIPVFKLTEEETQKLLKMEDELHKRVIGQEDAVRAVSQAIRRTRAGLKDPKRPSGSFIFLGPSGVGKTELSKTLAEFLFGDADALIALDMSEYMEKHTVSRLVGSPPGYVGYEEGGQLTEKIRRRPYAVVLLDEVEKAHSDVFNMLLQVMEEGHVTDSFGRVIDFRNVVLIMTSNIGADLIKNQSALGFRNTGEGRDADQKRKEVMDEVEKFFRPEFLNHFDDIVVFRSLGKEELTQILDLELAKVEKRLAQRDLHFELDESARDLLRDKGYDPSYGARPMRRAVEKHLEDPMAEEIIRGNLREGETVVISAKDDKLVFIQKKAKAKGEDSKVST